ncbi:hypothetical protein [Frigoribacterium sp. PhB24]|uniref:hypothetical protein n=1 Tax=Frigoribacterium sp. PhB24 TaxID=2485204 RepID=UPI000F9D4AE7|nr:hypothetical protein [Frigoribacterium sp. PhB24]ROS51376.1 hypothetical protein EDF50_1687 [Frigoribacterium sp. PhB24]
MSDADWPSIALALGAGLILLAASEMYRRRRHSRMRLSKQAELFSWDEVRTRSAKLSQGELQALRSGFSVGIANRGPVAGAFVVLLVSRRLVRRTSFDLLAAVPGERLGHELEVLLTTTDPDEVLEAQRDFELTFLPSGAEADALWSKCFR